MEDTTKKVTWSDRIDEANRVGRFNDDDYDAAQQWVDCACGEQDPAIPRFTKAEIEEAVEASKVDGSPTVDYSWSENAPKDDELRQLGVKFANAVDGNDIEYAEELLEKIDRRAEVIRVELGKLGKDAKGGR